MTKKLQFALAFGFGLLFVGVCLTVAIFEPHPSRFLYFVVRVTLALAAGGIATVVPGLLDLHLGPRLKAAGALAVFCVVYFFNPAHLAVDGTPTQLDGVFDTGMPGDSETTTYYWSTAGTSFAIPNERWLLSDQSYESGRTELTLRHANFDAAIQMSVGPTGLEQDSDGPSTPVDPMRSASSHETIGRRPAWRSPARSSDDIERINATDRLLVSRQDDTSIDFLLEYGDVDLAQTNLLGDYETFLDSVEFASVENPQ